MKKNILIVSTLAVMAVCAVFFLSSNESNSNVTAKKPHVMTLTSSVPIPQSLVFAGEQIDLTRYDNREKYDREINSFTYFHSTILLMLKRANRYFPIIEPILKENNIPDDFKYLAVIESTLDPRIVSPAKAAGMWQFLASTGKECGLTVTTEVDERYDPEKSTRAACIYLRNAYNKYGSWSSVALSYNGGQGRISSELQKQQVDEGLDLWLVAETTRYYFRMLAIKQIFENPAKYGFMLTADQLYKPLAYNNVTVDSTIEDLASFAQEQGVTYAQLKDFNSWLIDRKLTVTNNRSYEIKIPNLKAMSYGNGNVKVHNRSWLAPE